MPYILFPLKKIIHNFHVIFFDQGIIFFPTNLSLFFMYFLLNVDYCFPKKQKYPYFSVSSMIVNYIFPQTNFFCILHVCLHPEGMVFFHKQKFIQLLDIILIKYPFFSQQKINPIKNVMLTSC
jgi:hypothetical protein